MAKKTKTRNPQDTTIRNVRASIQRDTKLHDRIDVLDRLVRALAIDVITLRDRVVELGTKAAGEQ